MLVKFQDGRRVEINVDKYTLVSDVKGRIRLAEGTPEDEQQLTFDGKVLKDRLPLGQCRVLESPQQPLLLLTQVAPGKQSLMFQMSNGKETIVTIDKADDDDTVFSKMLDKEHEECKNFAIVDVKLGSFERSMSIPRAGKRIKLQTLEASLGTELKIGTIDKVKPVHLGSWSGQEYNCSKRLRCAATALSGSKHSKLDTIKSLVQGALR